MGLKFGPDHPETTYVPHEFKEQLADLGEVKMNYAVAGDASLPPLLLIPGQTESWWGYEAAMKLLAKHFQCYAVDLRGQGRSSRTPGRYTLDNMGNDLVRFIEHVIKRPAFVSGLSSGGLLSAWLSAYAPPGTVRAALWEDPPFFSAELAASVGQNIKQSIGPMFALFSKYLGDQWTIGDWQGLKDAAPRELPEWLRAFPILTADEPAQTIKEYDPEWGRAFWTGTVAASCDHARMLAATKVPVLFTHHFRIVNEETGVLMGAASDIQAKRVCEIVKATGVKFEYRSFPAMGHDMHRIDPALYANTAIEWFQSQN
jgi:pimeloyl-ACP methyl ester carboxylesterase